MNNLKRAPAAAALALAGLCLPFSGSAEDLRHPWMDFQALLDLRLRSEQVEQSNDLRDAHALTLRSRLGLKTAAGQGLSWLAEVEGTRALASERYNSGPGGNGNTDFSVIADPSGNELNQAYLNWAMAQDHRLRLGRQRLVFGNARYLGNVGWRQNEQTFDAASLHSKLSGAIQLDYAYLQRVHRIFFAAKGLDGHALQLHGRMNPVLSVSAYGYWLDFEQGRDSQTQGLRVQGSQVLGAGKLSYSAEYARQQDFAQTSAFKLDYLHAELSLARSGFSVALGLEQLDGDGQQGFATPLATLHKFNGWADVFIRTPPEGLRDAYLRLTHKRGDWTAKLLYHRFEAERGSARYGSEVDALLAWRFAPSHSLRAKLASYQADGFAVDTRKITLDWNFNMN